MHTNAIALMRLCTVVIILLMTSCVNTRKAVYFDHQRDAVFLDTTSVPSPIIQKNDLLGITVSSANPSASALFNMPAASYSSAPYTTPATAAASDYLVNAEGNIDLPGLGLMKAAGLTVIQLRDRITRTLTDRKLLVDPVVSIRYLNFKVTVLGEVAHPQVITVPTEKITLLEALGLAGDITIYGKREDVMVIRTEQNKKIISRLDLNSTMLFNSPYYHLRAGDVVYVEPNKARVAGSGRAAIWLPALLSGLSFIAIIADRATR